MSWKRDPEEAIRIGKKIKELRDKLSHREYSKIVGVSDVSLIYYEQGKVTPKLDTIKQIAMASGKDLSFFYPDMRKNSGSNNQETNGVPIVALASAGTEQLEDITPESYLRIPGLREKDCIAVSVRGQSMRPIIEENDILVVKKIDHVSIKRARTYVVVCDEGTRVKKIFPEKNRYRCASFNLEEPSFYTDNFRAVYKIITHIHPYRENIVF